MSFVDNVFEQTFKRHPYLFLFVIICCGAVLGHSYSVFAQEVAVTKDFIDHEIAISKRLTQYEAHATDRFTELESNIDDLGKSVSSQFAQQTIRQLNSEIYDLTNIIDGGDGNVRDHDRLKDLKGDLEEEERVLDGILR